MDRVETSDWICGVGGLVLLISTFFPWHRWSAGVYGSVSSGAGYGWLCFFLGLVAIVFVVLRVAGVDFELPFPDGLIYIGAGGLGILIAILRLIFRPGGFGFNASPHIGIFVALVGGAVVVVGGVMKLREV